MTGSKTTSMTLDELRQARSQGRSRTDLAKLRAATPFVWDGDNKDERSFSREETKAGVDPGHGRRSRPARSDKEFTTICRPAGRI